MEEAKKHISEAHDRAERAAFKLRSRDPESRYANDVLFEAWDELQTAAKLVEAAMQEIKRGV